MDEARHRVEFLLLSGRVVDRLRCAELGGRDHIRGTDPLRRERHQIAQRVRRRTARLLAGGRGRRRRLPRARAEQQRGAETSKSTRWRFDPRFTELPGYRPGAQRQHPPMPASSRTTGDFQPRESIITAR